MRHRKKIKKLSRSKDTRRSLFKNLAESVILYEKVTTTEAKAKAVRPYVERLISRSKVNTLHNRRQLLRALPTENSVNKLLDVLGPRYKERPGGYTRIIRVRNRKGDNAPQVMIRLV